MLTVKHSENGVETIVEAEKVERVRTGDAFSDGIFIDREPDRMELSADSQGGITSPRRFKHVFHFSSCESSNSIAPVVFVMNRHGATVARYDL